MATKLIENIRMFQIGEIYDLENPYNYKDLTKNTTSSHRIDALGVEPETPLFNDTNNNKYSRAMRMTRGCGIVDNSSTDYTVTENDVLTISCYIWWQESNIKLNEWMQDDLYFYINRNTVVNSIQLEGFTPKTAENAQFLKIVVDNPARKITIKIDNTINEISDIDAVSFNLATNSYIYIGINPDKDFYQPAMMGETPIIDDFKLTISSEEADDSKKSVYNTPRNITPLYWNDFKQKFTSQLKIY